MNLTTNYKKPRREGLLHRILSIFGALSAGVLGTQSMVASEPEDTSVHHFTREGILGTHLEVKLLCTQEEQALKGFELVLDEVERLSAIFDHRTSSSEITRLMNSQGVPMKVSDELLKALLLSQEANRKSKGSFTVFSPSFKAVWKEAEAVGLMPDGGKIEGLCQQVKATEQAIEIAGNWVTLPVRAEGLKMNLDALAKGLIIDQCIKRVIDNVGVDSALVNIGGDMASAGLPFKWDVLVRSPKGQGALDWLSLDGNAVATSGSYHRGYEINGAHYSHIIDAVTGVPVDSVVSSTVVAPTALEADRLATLLSLMGAKEGLEMINGMDDCKAMLVDAQQRVYYSDNWTPPAQQVKAGEPSANQQPVSITFNQRFSGKGKKSDRHYTVVWVEDSKGEKVKDILVWYKKKERKYLRDLKGWYSSGGKVTSKDAEFMASISEATKKAGSYTVQWDHTDNEGKLLPEGDYVIKIEVNREDGPGDERPTLAKVNIDTRWKKIKEEAPAKPELADVLIERK